MRIEHSMMEFFQPDDYRIVTDVMMRRYREYFRHELEPRHFFDATFDPLSNMVGLTVEQFKSRALVRDLASHGIDVTRSMRLDDLRWHVSRLTDAGLMNVRFRTLEIEDEGSNVVRLPSSLWNPYEQPPNLGSIPWDEGAHDVADKEIDPRITWGPTTISPIGDRVHVTRWSGGERPSDTSHPGSCRATQNSTQAWIRSRGHVPQILHVRDPIVSTSTPLITMRTFASSAMQVC
jgi:hypothetical protein